MTGFSTLVLAGSRPGRADPVAEAAGVSHKALAIVAGRTLLARVVGALAQAGAGEVAVSTSDGQVASEARRLNATPVASAAGPSLSVLAAAATLDRPLLVTTADHALLRPEWVTHFLSDIPMDADVAALAARREVVEAAAPGTRRTYLRLADASWSGCNLFHIRTDRGLGVVELWRRLEAQRKRPWRMAGLIGPGTLLRYAAGRLTTADAAARLSRLAGARAAVVPCPFGLCAVDVDTADDLAFVRRLLG